MNLLEDLNPSQREAVEYADGPSLIVAGAGSGKTRVLTYKIARLLEQGMQPWRVLALTFTNKAAREMKERIAKLVGEERAAQLQMGTFHSVFSRILRREAACIGYQPSFTIYDESDARSLIKRILKERELSDKVYKPADVHKRISRAKDNLETAEDYANNRANLESDAHAQMTEMPAIYAAYETYCRNANAMDFDDLLLLTWRLFAENPDVLSRYASRFQYILIDEYQDTNAAQQAVVLQLAQGCPRVCAVGDDYQSIYAFRGARIDNILAFQDKFPGARVFKLERNYRSTQLIVEAANSLMQKNAHQIPKRVYSEEDKGERVSYQQVATDKEEAALVARHIERLHRKDCPDYRDFAILYRTNSQSRAFEEVLRREGIPYVIRGGVGFYERKEIKDVLAYFRLVVNPDDEEAFMRVVNYPRRGIGDTTTAAVLKTAREAGASIWRTVADPIGQKEIGIGAAALRKLLDFQRLIDSFREQVDEVDAYTLGKTIIEKSGISADLYSSREPEYLSRQENLEELLGSMQSFVTGKEYEGADGVCTLTDFLQEVALSTDQDREGVDDNVVSMMTVHGAKGLEFPTVFVVGLEENIFPSLMSLDSPRKLEEERRLLYVAITRAKRHCYLTSARARFRYGTTQNDAPSRFLNDIDKTLLDTSSLNEPPKRLMPWERGGKLFEKSGDAKPPKQQTIPGTARLVRMEDALRSSGQTSREQLARINGLQVGSTIEHQRFGVGRVAMLEGEGENAKATVDFRDTGRKVLLLKFAKFTILG